MTNAPSSHVTASVADAQGNTNTVRVRFWIQPPTPRIIRLEPIDLVSRRVALRFENPKARTDHLIYASDDLMRPANSWTPATILNGASEPDSIRRLELQLPANFGAQCFLRVVEP